MLFFAFNSIALLIVHEQAGVLGEAAVWWGLGLVLVYVYKLGLVPCPWTKCNRGLVVKANSWLASTGGICV